MRLDKADAKILAALQRDGRRSVVDIAEIVGLTATPCARRIRQLESAGVIEGYSVVLNPRALGLAVQAFVQVKLTQHADDIVATFEREVKKLDAVIFCCATTGEADFLLHVAAPSLETLSNIVLRHLLKIPGVHDVKSSIVLDLVKRSSHLPLGHL
jgi:Lrp/AsnC family transcriptional regulator, leucine-responsive regulatory protein